MDDPADTRSRTTPDDLRLRELPPYLVAGNRYGSYGFGAGLSGLLLALCPFGTALAWVLVLVALGLGVVGFSRYAQGGATNRDTSVVGAAMGWIGLIVLVVKTSAVLNVPVEYYYGP